MIYVLKDNEPYGVVLTTKKYEGLNSEIDELYDKIDELILPTWLVDTDVKTYKQEEVLGDRSQHVTNDNEWK